jgi:hypothetical protein
MAHFVAQRNRHRFVSAQPARLGLSAKVEAEEEAEGEGTGEEESA